MYELIRLSEHDYYIDCPAKIGLVQLDDGTFASIDSGNDKDAGKKVLRHLEANGWKLSVILNTHSHADHIGGNRFLQDRTGCRVYAPGLECAFTKDPILESMVLWGGLPIDELKHKFTFAQESRAEPLTAETLPRGMEQIPLPGHSFDMTGFRTPDGNIFLGDCVSSVETLEKYGLGYLWDPEAYITTLETVKTLTAEKFIPAHAAVTEDIRPLAQYNIDAVSRAMETILELCREPVTFEQLLEAVFTRYGMTMNASQYALIGSTLRSYLSRLRKQGRAEFTFEGNRMLWHAV